MGTVVAVVDDFFNSEWLSSDCSTYSWMLLSRSAGSVKRGMLSSSSSDVLVCDFFVRKYCSRGAGRCSLHSLVGVRGIIRGGLRVDVEGWSWWCVVVVVVGDVAVDDVVVVAVVSDGDGVDFRVGTEGSGFAWLDVTGARPSLARDAFFFFFFFFFLFFFLFGGWGGSGGSDGVDLISSPSPPSPSASSSVAIVIDSFVSPFASSIVY